MDRRINKRGVRDFSPTSWVDFFDEAHDICPAEILEDNHERNAGDKFRVYLKNFKKPYAPQRKATNNKVELESIEVSVVESTEYRNIPTLVTLHGGGYSALTWAQFSRFIEQMCKCRILSLDLRGHGDTKTSDDGQMNINTLVDDVISVIHATHRLCGFIETPKIVLIGHSMGGAIAIKCSVKCTELLPSLAGFVIIDVVEGTAKDALPLMLSVIQNRPTRFESLKEAIEWSIRSGMAKNIDAARVSMPSNLLNIEHEHLGIHDIEVGAEKKAIYRSVSRNKFPISSDQFSTNLSTSMPPPLVLSPRVSALRSAGLAPKISYPRPKLDDNFDETSENSIANQEDLSKPEEIGKGQSGSTGESVDDATRQSSEPVRKGYCWRTNLAQTQPFWNDWFDGLSAQLLDAPVQGKFLLLAGIDRLDKTLTIGQMQGKFMMKVLPKCGHAVHEDVPHQVASEISQFLIRNKFTVN